MILDKRTHYQQWAEKIFDAMKDDLVFADESEEGVIEVLKDYEHSILRVARNQFIDEMHPDPTEREQIKREKYIEMLKKNGGF